jgi:hypothetical protein
MSLLSNLLLVVSLAALSLAACTGEADCADEQCQVDSDGETRPSDAPDLIRIEIEIDGAGTVMVDSGESVTCTGDQGLCSFSYARGTELAIFAEGDFSFQDDCTGSDPCTITLDTDKVVVANFLATSEN